MGNDVYSDHVARLGSDLGAVYNALWNDVASLSAKWQEFLAMFGTRPERVDLLNSAAGLFFRIVQDALWDDMLLHLCRLTDPPKSCDHSNLTIRALPGLITDSVLCAEVAALIENAVEATSFAREWRNRRLSHRDLELAINPVAKPLPPTSRGQVSQARSAIHAVLNLISERLLRGTLEIDVMLPATGAEALLYVIRDGLEADRARRARISSGTFTQEDLRHEPV
jgi:hypothetical protein